MNLPGYQCKQALYDRELRAAIAAISECLPDSENVQDIADELTACTPLYAVQDIYIRLLSASLCYLGEGGGDCDKPDPKCDCYTVTTPATSGSLDIYDPWMKCADFPFTEIVSGNITSSASGVYGATTGSMSFFTAMSFPILTFVDGYVFVGFQESLLSFSAPLLTETTGSFQVGSNANQTSITIPLITTVGGDFVTSGTLYTSLSVPLLTSVGGTLISIGGRALVDVDISGLTTFVGDFECVNANLSVTSINNILIQLDSVVVLTGAHDVLLDGNTSAAPTGAGATAKANLIGRGVNVQTN
jgi:hypothetical protein